MSTTTTSTTDIPLSTILREGPPDPAISQPELSNFDPADPDTIIAASRLADSQVPDGGYGWVVVFASSILTFWFVGTTYSWGVIQAALVAQKLSSPSTLSFVGSLTCSCIAFLALVNARIIRAVGARTTALVGVILLGAGEVFSGWSTRNLGGLFVNAGVIMGVGASLQFMVLPPDPLCSTQSDNYRSYLRSLLNTSTKNAVSQMALSTPAVDSAEPSSLSPWTA